jgi:hypothetical protein
VRAALEAVLSGKEHRLQHQVEARQRAAILRNTITTQFIRSQNTPIRLSNHADINALRGLTIRQICRTIKWAARRCQFMTRIERLLTPSTVACCVCDHPLSIQELEEFRAAVDESLYGEVHCRSCMEEQMTLCGECSTRYTTDMLCSECAAREYALAG